MNHSFDVEIAKEYGMLGAVLINHIMFWTEKNRANRRNFYDGRYWIYNSSKAFSELFPYVSAWTINSTLNKLVEAGILIKGNYNTTPMDRTLWFALSDKGLELVKSQKCIFANPKMEICDSKNGNLQSQKCLNTDINTDSNTDIKPNIKQFASPAMQSAFDDWVQYKTEKRDKYTQTGLKSLVTRLNNDIQKKGEQAVIDAIYYSMSQGWKGIYYPDNKTDAGGNNGNLSKAEIGRRNIEKLFQNEITVEGRTIL